MTLLGSLFALDVPFIVCPPSRKKTKKLSLLSLFIPTPCFPVNQQHGETGVSFVLGLPAFQPHWSLSTSKTSHLRHLRLLEGSTARVVYFPLLVKGISHYPNLICPKNFSKWKAGNSPGHPLPFFPGVYERRDSPFGLHPPGSLEDLDALTSAVSRFTSTNLGGTAIGTGIAADPCFSQAGVFG